MRQNNVQLKTSIDVFHQRKACQLAFNIIKALGQLIEPGVTTGYLDKKAESILLEHHGTAALKGYRGYPATICTSINNVAAHGVPGHYILDDGDIITVDITVELGGWYGDIAWTFIAGTIHQDHKRLLKASWQATMAGINAARAGARLGDIGRAIQETAGKFGCSVLEDLVGHGIGKNLHEDPVVLNIGKQGTGLPVVPGMVLTIEPIVTLGEKHLKTLSDGWSIVSRDNSLSAQFEHTIAIFGRRTEVLTMPEKSPDSSIDFPPFF